MIKTGFFRYWKIDISKNKIITLLGPSGSGKTTFLNLLIGF